jgi:hypothetical protein
VPEVVVATVLPLEVNVTVAPATLAVPEIVYDCPVDAVKVVTLALPLLTVTDALVGENE